VEDRLDQSLVSASLNIEAVIGTVTEIMDVFDQVEQSLGTIERTLTDVGLALDETRPIIDTTSKLITHDIPQGLDDVQDTMPSIVEAAATVDQSLAFLSKFKFSVPIPFGTPLEVDLGVDYDPEVPFEDAIINLSGTLEGIPDQLRSIEDDLVTVDLNLAVMGDDLIDIAGDIEQMDDQIADINPELERVIAGLLELTSSLASAQSSIPAGIEMAWRGFAAFMVFIIIAQIPSTFTGYLLIRTGFPRSKYNPESSKGSGKAYPEGSFESADPMPAKEDNYEVSRSSVR